MLNHDQGVAGIAQPVHDADDAFNVARMQSDRRFIEHEQRIDQRCAERRGEVDALHFAAGQGARLAVEVQISEADIGQIFEARANLPQQQIGGFIEQRRQFERRKEFAASSIDSSIKSRMFMPGLPTRHSNASGLRRAPRQAPHSV